MTAMRSAWLALRRLLVATQPTAMPSKGGVSRPNAQAATRLLEPFFSLDSPFMGLSSQTKVNCRSALHTSVVQLPGKPNRSAQISFRRPNPGTLVIPTMRTNHQLFVCAAGMASVSKAWDRACMLP